MKTNLYSADRIRDDDDSGSRPWLLTGFLVSGASVCRRLPELAVVR